MKCKCSQILAQYFEKFQFWCNYRQLCRLLFSSKVSKSCRYIFKKTDSMLKISTCLRCFKKGVYFDNLIIFLNALQIIFQQHFVIQFYANVVLKIEFLQRCGNFHKQVYLKANHFYFCKISYDCLEINVFLFIYCAKFQAKVLHVEIGFNFVQLPVLNCVSITFIYSFLQSARMFTLQASSCAFRFDYEN